MFGKVRRFLIIVRLYCTFCVPPFLNGLLSSMGKRDRSEKGAKEDRQVKDAPLA